MKDIEGTELAVGDNVVFTAARKEEAKMRRGKIVGFGKRHGRAHIQYKIKVAPHSKQWDHGAYRWVRNDTAEPIEVIATNAALRGSNHILKL